MYENNNKLAAFGMVNFKELAVTVATGMLCTRPYLLRTSSQVSVAAS